MVKQADTTSGVRTGRTIVPINVVLDRMILGLMLAIVLTIACPVAAALWGQSHASASRSGPAASAAGIDGQRASRGV